jgi:hypothetical protein
MKLEDWVDPANAKAPTGNERVSRRARLGALRDFTFRGVVIPAVSGGGHVADDDGGSIEISYASGMVSAIISLDERVLFRVVLHRNPGSGEFAYTSRIVSFMD